MVSRKASVLRTLAYADVFDFPLSLEELWKFIISEKKIDKDTLKKNLHSFSDFINSQDGFYYFKDRKRIIQIRKQRAKESRKKLVLAKKIASRISIIPTIRFLGISGALAMGNAKETDDIDFFIITKKGTLWITRFLCLLYLEILGVRRKRNQKNLENKICLNMFMDETNLSLPHNKRNLYTAHEVFQIKPLLDRNDTHLKFLLANRWVIKFLPNSVGSKVQRFKGSKILREDEKQSPNILISQYLNIFTVLEWIAKKVQVWYMRRHRTKEIVSKHLLAFHPKDYQEIILKEYAKRLQEYEKA